MLYESFKEVRKLFANNIPEIITTQWFNAQYEATIYASPVCFVEFPNRIPLEQITGSNFRGDFAMRIHIVSAAQGKQDNSIDDSIIAEHEAIAERAIEVLQGKQIYMGKGNTTRLIPSGWQHYHNYRGFLVTFLEFTATAYNL